MYTLWMMIATNIDIYLSIRCDFNNSSPGKAVHYAVYLLSQQDLHQHDPGPDHCLSHSGDSYPGEPDFTESIQAKESLRPEGFISRYRYGWHGNHLGYFRCCVPDRHSSPCQALLCCCHQKTRTIIQTLTYMPFCRHVCSSILVVATYLTLSGATLVTIFILSSSLKSHCSSCNRKSITFVNHSFLLCLYYTNNYIYMCVCMAMFCFTVSMNMHIIL